MNVTNYFDIPNPETWHCSLKSISEDATLKIKVFKPYTKGNRLTITFMGVVFYNTPTIWEGTDFQVGSHEECLKLLHRLRDFQTKTTSHEDLLSRYKLFTLQLKNSSESSYIHIIATNATIEPAPSNT